MRVTNNLIYGQSSNAISKANERYMDVQEKIAAQTNIIKASDDPVGASQVLQYESSNQKLRQYDDAMSMAASNLEYQEVALDSLNSLLDDARSLLIQGQNEINTQADVDAISQELAIMVESMADLMNSKSAEGDYIFAGTDTSSPAFVLGNDGRYEWAGNESQKFAQISEGMKIAVTDSGKKLFEDVWARNNFSAHVESGEANLATEIRHQGDFDAFMDEHYDPINPLNNHYRLTTFAQGEEPTLVSQVESALDANGDVIEETAEQELADQLGDVLKEEEYDNRPYFGPSGQYVLTNSFGEEVASGEYHPSKPIVFEGMSFSINSAPGAVIDFELNPPRRDNVLNEIKKTLSIISDEDSSMAEREKAFFDATTSITNTQSSIGQGRSSIGARMNTLSDKGNVNSASQLSNAIAQDKVGGLDVGAAATDLAMAESALTASQKLFSRINNLSLFNQI
ncbi:flagellar hook-associated protein FlgL [Marinomonas sp.]